MLPTKKDLLLELKQELAAGRLEELDDRLTEELG